MFSSKRVAIVATVVVWALLAAPPGAAAYEALNPGGVTWLSERVPVNVVFVGLEKPRSGAVALRSARQLPGHAQPPRALALLTTDFRSSWVLTTAMTCAPTTRESAWEDDFFAYLSSIAVSPSRPRSPRSPTTTSRPTRSK